jgi:hypothetical protein
MIKRPTIVLLIIFALVLGLAFLIPVLQGDEDKSDQLATPRPKFLPTGDTYVKILLLENGSEVATLHQQKDGNWVVDYPSGASVSTGEVEQIFSELAAIEIVSSLPTPPAASSVSLDAPKWILQLTDSKEEVIMVKVGDAAPTGSAYYVILDNKSPVVINRYGLDRVIEILSGLIPVPLATETTPGE